MEPASRTDYRFIVNGIRSEGSKIIYQLGTHGEKAGRFLGRRSDNRLQAS